ncbi:MAG: C40 family peptidase [Flavobacteriales bacterium]|nr:C40 family peptidase [Flavobacteriales bacterium]MDG1349041.1 C40 family peptidase [Flavobacteriales bacterium]|tara:strand:- start:6723 stop:7487 length:765 start_codon:yes stop_codon:yes gene_type:complete
MQYGISNLSIIPMRNEAADQAEMVNQILFGEHFKVLESRKKWSRIRLAHDSYEGWICNKQWIEIPEDIYKQLDKEVATITTDILDIITKDHHQPIVIGSILPSYKSGHALINNEMYQFDGLTTPGFVKKEKLVENSLMYLNAPYLWGGRSPLGIDCSGFSQIVYRLQGVDLPRDAYQQAEVGTTLSFIEESEPGDLAFFDNKEGKIIHVGIILEDNHIIHASGKVRIDRIDQQGIFNTEIGSHTHKLRLIKSIC